jgi:hypothetical protein
MAYREIGEGDPIVLEVVADVAVLPTKPTTRGFDPAGVRID